MKKPATIITAAVSSKGIECFSPFSLGNFPISSFVGLGRSKAITEAIKSAISINIHYFSGFRIKLQEAAQ